MNGYVWFRFFCAYKFIKFALKKFKEILKYKFVIMCMLNTPD
jgi:hypothetical protein